MICHMLGNVKRNMKINKHVYLLCFLMLLCTIISIWIPIATYLILVFGVIAGIDLYVRSDVYIQQDKEHPKHKTFKSLAFLSVFILSMVVVLNIVKLSLPLKQEVFEDMQFYLLIFLVVVYGNSAPKLPFNKHLGLRLPWTIKNEDVWMYAHRVCGYAAFPTAILMYVTYASNMQDVAIMILVFGMVIIPGVLSYRYEKICK